MAGIELIEGLGLILAAASAPTASMQTVALLEAPAATTTAMTVVPRRTRDERIGAAALRGFPAAEQWIPPAKSWGEPGGPVVEVGALGTRRSGQPDLAHLTFNWQF